jgi:hypothetical protein
MDNNLNFLKNVKLSKRKKSKSKSKSSSSKKRFSKKVKANVVSNNEVGENALINAINNSEKTNFNAIIRDCVKNKELTQKFKFSMDPVYATKEAYDKSFTSIELFSKKFTPEQLKTIDTIVFNENNDGFFAGAIAYHALKELGAEIKNIVKIKPSGSYKPDRDFDRGSSVFFVDIDFSEFSLKYMLDYCKYMIVIDDHQPKMKHPNFYSSYVESKKANDHAACACTWKFFYPRENVPFVLSYVDSSDSKLYLPWVSYTNLFNEAMGFRYTHTRSPKITAKIKNGELFKELWVIMMQSNVNDLITFGNYYFQVTEDLKDQIAINAQIRDFQGYKVGVLNYRSPALNKKVARQISTNLAGKIDFVVLWGWEYTINGYGITLIDDHKQTKVDLHDLGEKLKVIGGHFKGGGGHKHVYNLYWSRNEKTDIWDLFEKQLI